jgi:hypothetical protein
VRVTVTTLGDRDDEGLAEHRPGGGFSRWVIAEGENEVDDDNP